MIGKIKNFFSFIFDHCKMGWYIAMLQECGEVIPYEKVPETLEAILQKTMQANETYTDKEIHGDGEFTAIYIVDDDPKNAKIVYSIPSIMKWYKIKENDKEITVPYLMGAVIYNYAHERTHMLQGLNKKIIDMNQSENYKDRWYEKEAIHNGIEELKKFARAWDKEFIDEQSSIYWLKRVGTTLC